MPFSNIKCIRSHGFWFSVVCRQRSFLTSLVPSRFSAWQQYRLGWAGFYTSVRYGPTGLAITIFVAYAVILACCPRILSQAVACIDPRWQWTDRSSLTVGHGDNARLSLECSPGHFPPHANPHGEHAANASENQRHHSVDQSNLR